MTAPNFKFVEIVTFEELFRPLVGAELANAEMLLEAAARWIFRKRPDIAVDDPDAVVVSVAVVKSALLSMQYGGLSSFTNTLGPRSKAGTLTNPDAALMWADWMFELLGISRNTQAAYYFGDCDPDARY